MGVGAQYSSVAFAIEKQESYPATALSFGIIKFYGRGDYIEGV